MFFRHREAHNCRMCRCGHELSRHSRYFGQTNHRCAGCDCTEVDPRGRFAFIVDDVRFETDDAAVSAAVVQSRGWWAGQEGREVLWLRDGGTTETLPTGSFPGRLYPTCVTPRFMSIPRAHM